MAGGGPCRAGPWQPPARTVHGPFQEKCNFALAGGIW